MIEFYKEIFKLKTLLRKGWVMRDVCDKGSGRVESDGEHIFSTALIAMIVMKKKNLKLDEAKVLKLALIHELEKSILEMSRLLTMFHQKKSIWERKAVLRGLPKLMTCQSYWSFGMSMKKAKL